MAYLNIYSGHEFYLAFAVVLAAGIVRGYTGFGAGLVMVPLLAIMWGPVEALATSVVVGIAATLQLVPRALKLANWRDAAPMMISTVVFTPMGTALLISLDPGIVKKMIAVLVLGVTLITLYGWTYRGPRGPAASATAGAIGGAINGLAGVGGPPLVLYLLSLPEKPEVHRANIVMALATSSTMTTIGLFVAGAISPRVITHSALLLLPSIIAVWLGARLFTIIPGKAFRLVILWFLVAISLAILFA